MVQFEEKRTICYDTIIMHVIHYIITRLIIIETRKYWF